MSITFLQLTNRVLRAFNEVTLSSSDFSGAVGFHAEAKDAINIAITDFYSEENNEWPFAWAEITLPTVVGTQKYTLSSSITTVDWDSFRIQKPQVVVSSLTQSAGTATCTTASAHYAITDDIVFISGATPTAYNGTHTITRISDTQFTFPIASTTTSPATGTIYVYPPFPEKKLPWISYDEYRNSRMEQDRNTVDPDTFGVPDCIVRTLDDSILISGKPDRVYPIVYEGFLIPTRLSAYDDTISVATKYETLVEQAIVDKALHYCYMFRDNIEQASMAEDRYKSNCNKIRRLLIVQDYYMRFE